MTFFTDGGARLHVTVQRETSEWDALQDAIDQAESSGRGPFLLLLIEGGRRAFRPVDQNDDLVDEADDLAPLGGRCDIAQAPGQSQHVGILLVARLC